jgi:hypothetical protein
MTLRAPTYARTLRFRFWAAALDALARYAYGSRAYYWVLVKLARCVDY